MEKHKTLAILEIITGIGVIFFWIGFFTIGLAPKNPPECYFVFEHSFPLPDVILSIGLIIAGVFLLKQKSAGRPLSLVCAGALMFLGVLDFSFNIQNGMYCLALAESAGNAFINIWCAGFGFVLAIKLGRDS